MLRQLYGVVSGLRRLDGALTWEILFQNERERIQFDAFVIRDQDFVYDPFSVDPIPSIAAGR